MKKGYNSIYQILDRMKEIDKILNKSNINNEEKKELNNEASILYILVNYEPLNELPI